MKLNLILFLSFLLIGSWANANSSVYVTDNVDIPLRSENKVQHNPSNLLRMLPSGTQLEILATKDGWTKVKFENTIGWMSSRFITPTLPAKVQLDKLKQIYEVNKLSTNVQKKRTQELEKTQKELKQRNIELSAKVSKHQAEKKHIEQVYQNALKLEHTSEKLKAEVLRFKTEIQLLNSNNISAQATSARNWFVVGALVLLFGLFIGFIFSKRSPQKHRRF